SSALAPSLQKPSTNSASSQSTLGGTRRLAADSPLIAHADLLFGVDADHRTILVRPSRFEAPWEVLNPQLKFVHVAGLARAGDYLYVSDVVAAKVFRVGMSMGESQEIETHLPLKSPTDLVVLRDQLFVADPGAK